MTTVLLVSNDDLAAHIGELNFTSEEAAHFYMSAELPNEPYCFESSEMTIYERF